jgi:hypothetical protein
MTLPVNLGMVFTVELRVQFTEFLRFDIDDLDLRVTLGASGLPPAPSC